MRLSLQKFHSILTTLAVAASATSGLASTNTLIAKDCGFYNSVGRHSKLDGSPSFGSVPGATFNYSVGTIDEGPPFGPPGSPPDVFRKNFFTFGLTNVSPGSVVGGTLKIFLPPTGYSNSLSPSLTYKLYGLLVSSALDMSTQAVSLKAVHSPFVPPELTEATNLYAKITSTKTVSIPAFGSITVTPAAAGTMLTISLSPFGVTYLNLYAGGDVVLGGELDALTTAGGPPDDPPIFLFGFSSPVIPGGVPWDMSSVTPTPTPELELIVVDPTLTISSTNTGQATISWTPNTPGFVLQGSLSLAPTAWTNSPSGTTNPITVPADLTTKFYRLTKP